MLCVDVDALCKLAHWNILPLLPEITGYHWSDMATISSVKHRANRALEKPDGRLFHSVDAAKVVCECIEQMDTLPSPHTETLSALAESHQIDSGEAVLLAAIAGDTKGILLTGDKRALRGLAQLDCAGKFAGRIMLIEQIIWLCLRVRGRDWLLSNVCPYQGMDKAISIVLGSQCDASTDSINDGIASYLAEIENLHNPSLLYQFD